jgi:hypothetical protein
MFIQWYAASNHDLKYASEEQYVSVYFKYFDTLSRFYGFRDVDYSWAMITTLSNGQRHSAAAQYRVKTNQICTNKLGYEL